VNRKLYSHICKWCDNTFLSKYYQSTCCYSCKEPRLCKCGCGRLVKTPGYLYSLNCIKRGKSYLEIYGTSTPNCGFSRGESNIAKLPEIRKKIRIGVRKSYDNPSLIEQRRKHMIKLHCESGILNYTSVENFRREKFRSRLERDFSELLIQNNIKYLYEVPVKLRDKSIKFVDFQVGNILIEISGYAYDEWRKDFNRKIKLLRRSTDKQIIILTYPENLEEIYTNLIDNDIYVRDVYDKDKILNTITFCENINKIKMEVNENGRMRNS